MSREFLRGIPAKLQQEKVDRIIKASYNDLYTTASAGATSYFYDRSLTNQADELVPFFKERFPDCKITYEEHWGKDADDTPLLRKGIRIDWS